MKQGEFKILEQPSKSILSIILVDINTNLPLSEKDHDKLEKLEEVSDLFFIFPEHNIKTEVFSTLYNACGYIESLPGELSTTLIRTFEYDCEIFEKCHIQYLYTQLSDFTEIDLEKLQWIAANGISKPIFRSRRLSSVEFFEIYKEDKPTTKTIIGGYIDQWIKNNKKENNENLYCSYGTNSKEILLKPQTISKFLKFWEREDKVTGFSGVGYVNSFTNPDLRYLLASMCKKTKVGCLEIEANELK